MDRAEATGFGVAFAGHAALLAALSLGLATARVPPLQQDPIEVSFVDEVGLESTAPTPSAEAPAPRLAEIEGPVEPLPAPPAPVIEPAPVPAVRPTPQPQPKLVPQPKAVARPQPKAVPQQKAVARPQPARPAPAAKQVPAKSTQTRSTGRLKGLLSGLSDGDTNSRSTTPPAKAAGPAVQASLARAVREQLKPHWKAPTGADAEQLRTQLSIWLSPNGSVTRIEVIGTTGQTSSNRPQVKLHQEQAVRAVRLAAPFRLPAEYYDSWKHLSPIGFDKRLSQ
jgi:outer membrane biosynthesis protein TonB